MAAGLIIYDCDGVLIDSEVLSATVLIEEAARHGGPLTPAYVREHFLGRSFPTVAQVIRDSFAVSLPPISRPATGRSFSTGSRPTCG